MTDPTLQSQIDAATAYEQLFVPALFQEWAPRVTAAAGIRPGHRVLDVACGTGVLAREAAVRTGSPILVVGVDPGRGMLAVAAQIAPGIEWREGTAESLPCPDACFDAVVSQFGLMFFPDRPRALREMMRALKPGGRLAVAVWDSLDTSPGYADEVELLERTAGPRAAEAVRAPYVLGDQEALASLFADAGVESIAIERHEGTARFPSIRTMVEADLRGWLPLMGVVLPEEQIGEILREAEHVLARYGTPDGTIAFDAPALIVTGTTS